MRLLYYCYHAKGGLAAYAHEQANALVDDNCQVTLVTAGDYKCPPNAKYTVARIFPARPVSQHVPSSVARALRAWRLVWDQFRFVRYASREDFHYILLGSFFEYLSPLWAWRFRVLTRRGVVLAAVVHDPIRDFVIGPLWWHKWSLAAAYSLLREAFVHAPVDPSSAGFPPSVRLTVVPQGPYHWPRSMRPRVTVRLALNLPHDAPVMLAFGHLRTGKNLDLFLEILPQFPSVYLIIAGKEQNSRALPGSHYQRLAQRLGVYERCRWFLGYVPEETVSELFEAVDFTLLTYSRDFRSASAVLNTATFFRRLCLASSGEGNLKQMVQEFQLGVWVEPDDSGAMAKGLQTLLDNPPTPRWLDYERENSWAENAQRVVSRMASGASAEYNDE